MLAGFVVWGVFSIAAQRAGTEEANRLLSAFAMQMDPGERQAALEGQAEIQLFQADRYARVAFLRASLEDTASLQRMIGREQGLSVALSRIDSAEAQALFRKSVLPAIERSTDPQILRECFGFMRQWSIAGREPGVSWSRRLQRRERREALGDGSGRRQRDPHQLYAGRETVRDAFSRAYPANRLFTFVLDGKAPIPPLGER